MNVIYIHRISSYFYRKQFVRLSSLCNKIGFLIFNSHVPGSASIGDHTKAAYGGIGIVVHSHAKIGSRVILGQGITIGRQLDPSGVPEIGNDVYISAGARILGNITVGNNVIIGANSVVINDVPDNCIVAGTPAKIIKSVDQSIYDLLKNVY
jgi:serine O-acetyltransferase